MVSFLISPECSSFFFISLSLFLLHLVLMGSAGSTLRDAATSAHQYAYGVRFLNAYLGAQDRMRNAPDSEPLFFDIVNWTVVTYDELVQRSYHARSHYRLAFPVDYMGYFASDTFNSPLSYADYEAILRQQGIRSFPTITKPGARYMYDHPDDEWEYGEGEFVNSRGRRASSHVIGPLGSRNTQNALFFKQLL